MVDESKVNNLVENVVEVCEDRPGDLESCLQASVDAMNECASMIYDLDREAYRTINQTSDRIEEERL